MKTTVIIPVLVLFLFPLFLSAQEVTQSADKNIFESLASPDSITGAKVTVHQDKRVEQMLTKKKVTKNGLSQSTSNGYRVQVFSSNAQRSAKNEAFKIEKQIKDLFPEEEVYVNYTSPFWKVRVGDFESMDRAQAFRAQLIEILPQIKSETYIVREQIRLSVSK